MTGWLDDRPLQQPDPYEPAGYRVEQVGDTWVVRSGDGNVAAIRTTKAGAEAFLEAWQRGEALPEAPTGLP